MRWRVRRWKNHARRKRPPSRACTSHAAKGNKIAAEPGGWALRARCGRCDEFGNAGVPPLEIIHRILHRVGIDCPPMPMATCRRNCSQIKSL